MKIKLNSPRSPFVVVVIISKFFAKCFQRHKLQIPSAIEWKSSAQCRANLLNTERIELISNVSMHVSFAEVTNSTPYLAQVSLVETNFNFPTLPLITSLESAEIYKTCDQP